MRFDVITLFPELFGPHLTQGVTRRAFSAGGGVAVRLWPLRAHALDAYRRVDDRPYGGGPGMVMLAEPLERAMAAVTADREQAGEVILFSPAGRHLDQSCIERLAQGPGAVLVCGRYEGVDQRFVDRHVTLELSLGDFVLSGGEIAAIALLDGVARLQPGVLLEASHRQDSFSDGLLEGPHYSRPERLEGPDGAAAREVPSVLLSGHHVRIERWRREQSLALTARRRPDLIEAARKAGRIDSVDEAFLASLGL
jgi:tRNA (guanine37-N1)-methyltransferase